MDHLLVIQEIEFSVTKSMHPSKLQPFYTHVNTLVTSDVEICFPAPYLNLHAKYSHMPNMPAGLTGLGLPYIWATICNFQQCDILTS